MQSWAIDFRFVTDERLRDVLEEYHSQAVKAYDAGAYVGTLVACGSVLEGLLTWALLGRKDDAIKSAGAHKNRDGQTLPIEKWNLSNLIDVAVTLGLLGKTAKDACWAVKDFRNFVHPHNLLAQSGRPDQALAIGALVHCPKNSIPTLDDISWGAWEDKRSGQVGSSDGEIPIPRSD